MTSSIARPFLFFLALCASAFQSAPPATSVRLDVVASDKSGRPVAGLHQTDFTILDNKQPQRIVSFEAAGQNASPGDQVEVVLVIDAVNTSFLRVGYERDQITKFLQRDAGRLSRPVSLAFSADSGFTIQNAPSLDGNALAAYLGQQQSALRTIHRSQGFYGTADRSQISLRALSQLALYEAKKPNRKLVIWLSPGWPLLTGPRVQLSNKDQQNIFHSIVSLSTQLRDARIALYSVDPLGAEGSGQLRDFYYEQFLKPVTASKQVQFGNLALQVLAIHSGGRVFNGTNDVAGEIEACVRDANSYYVLSYDPPPADGPDEYHAIQVKISQPGLKAQTTAGYYAQPAQPAK